MLINEKDQINELLTRVEHLEDALGIKHPQIPRKGQLVWVWDGCTEKRSAAAVFDHLNSTGEVITRNGTSWDHWRLIQPEEIQ